MASAADVPGKFDVVINGQGYTFFRPLDGSYLTSGRHHAEYGYTPTFVERTNVGSAYGDNQQSFFLTASQNDWSEGEQQRFFRANDKDSIRRYWSGTAVDRREPGSVKMGANTASNNLSLAATALGNNAISATAYASSSAKLYSVNVSAFLADLGAHGLGAAPTSIVVDDVSSVYLSTTTAGTVGIRKFVIPSTYTTFSATPCSSLAFLNNGLYGVDAGNLYRFDTAGVATTLNTWKGASGTVVSNATQFVCAYGGKLLVLRGGTANGPELWIYDGISTSKVAGFPENFIIGVNNPIIVDSGIVYVAGILAESGGGGFTKGRACVYYWANGTIGLLWASQTPATSGVFDVAIGAFDGGIVWASSCDSAVFAYDLALGAVSTIASPAITNSPMVASCPNFLLLGQSSSTTVTQLPGTGTATTTTVASSLFDFDSSLTKLFRGIKVDWSPATDGDGGSVDIAYQVDSVDGAYTNLQTGATSGTEYLLSSVSGHSISAKVTLNRGTSTKGPVLKRVYVRAAPTLQTYKLRTYNLDLTSTQSLPTQLQDGSNQPLAGHEQAVNLIASIQSSTPITITDRFGTYTGILEPDQCRILELHSDGDTTPATSGQFVATLFAREV